MKVPSVPYYYFPFLGAVIFTSFNEALCRSRKAVSSHACMHPWIRAVNCCGLNAFVFPPPAPSLTPCEPLPR